MKSFKIKSTLALVFLCLVSLSYSTSEVENTKDIPEVTDEEYDEIRNQYRIEEKKDEKMYQECALHPEKYDLNKDRKISRKELIKAITYLLFPKTRGEKAVIHPKIANIVKNKIQAFVNEHPEFLTYRQFSHIIMTVKSGDFINSDYFDQVVQMDSMGLEYESEL